MSARYRITVCRDESCKSAPTHFVVTCPEDTRASPTLREALDWIAYHEAHRLAGNDWSLWQADGRIHMQRQGDARAAKVRTWEEAAVWLAAITAANRKPLVAVAS